MSYGIGTGLGAPVGGAANNLGSTTNAPAATGGLNFGSTLSSNLWLTGTGNILSGLGELAQSGLFGPTGTGTGTGYTPSTSTGTGTLPGNANTSLGSYNPTADALHG